MAKPISFEQNNSWLLGFEASELTEAVGNLPVRRGGGEIVSCWKLSPFERLYTLLTGKVWIYVKAEKTHSPIYVEGAPLQ